MHVGEFMVVIATLVGPVLAVQAQKWIERWRSAKDRKIEVFRKLMTTRATQMSPQHIEALNQIDLEFHKGKKYKKVIDAWRAYFDHLNQKTPERESQSVWINKKIDLLAELLYEMGKSLDYDFDIVHIKRAAYFPQGYGDLENDQLVIRKALVALFKGEIALPMKVVAFLAHGDTEEEKAFLVMLKQVVKDISELPKEEV